MPRCCFVSDLHGRLSRYTKLFDSLRADPPEVLFIGGDILPHWGLSGDYDDFIEEVVGAGLRSLRAELGTAYPGIFVILGNDDPRSQESRVWQLEEEGLWAYSHGATHRAGDYTIAGYAYVPPTPFLNKDWERYDVSRYVPPGSISPEEGFRSVDVDSPVIRYSTIARDLDDLAAGQDLSRWVFLFHTPPYETHLDRVGNDGRKIDHVPLDLNVGSIAVRRFIEARQPWLTLHGHIHESARLTGSWRDRIGATWLLGAAHDGPELSLVRFDLEDPESAERLLL